MVLDITILSLIVIGVTEAIKRGLKIPSRLIPLIAIALAVFLGGMAAISGISGLNFMEGIIAGLMACGLWSSLKTSIKKQPIVAPPPPAE